MDIERPGRYLGSEIGAQPGSEPDERGFILRTVLAFPEVYEIAHSHLGHKILYHLFNHQKGFSAERVYAPWPDYEKRLLGRPLRSLETRSPLSEFHVVGFSLQYELSYTNILNMLALGGVNPRRAERAEGTPLIVAGGPGAANPEPLADFFDVFFVGEAEDAWLGDYTIIKDWAYAQAPKAELYERLAGRPGVYLPALFEPEYEKGQYLGSIAKKAGYETIPRATVARLTGSPFPSRQIVPWVKPVHDRVVVEIARGCARGCRFCQAGYIYRPVRERERQEILTLVDQNLAATGYDEAAFLSLSAGDHSQIESLCAGFMGQWAEAGVALSLPSLRVKSLSPALAQQIARVRKTGFTIAPEAASARLRAVINKDLTEDDLFAACQTAFSLGWRTLKLYFMTGLPTESPEDLQALLQLTQRVKKMSRAQINVSVATFIPKPHTPFQWRNASSEAEIQARLKILSAGQKPGLDIRYSSAEAALVEAILARGDRRLAPVIEDVWRAGARFEAWNENLKVELWKEALERRGFALNDLLGPKDPAKPLPWERIGPFVQREFLLRELVRAENAQTTPDCRQAGCQGCGACAGKAQELAANLAANMATPPTPDSDQIRSRPILETVLKKGRPAGLSSGQETRFLVEFTKTGPMSLLGHLEMVEALKKSFRRSGLPVAYSQGFHPQPKLSFMSALPLGLESLSELMVVTLTERKSSELLRSSLDLPEGLDIIRVQILPPNAKKLKVASISYLIEADKAIFIDQPLHSAASINYTDSKGKTRRFELAEFVVAAIPDQRRLTLVIKPGLTGTPKPLAVTRALYGLNEEPLKIKKIATNLA
jgi:radical SAM family uncharacterized protein/radical SAM-linked protein